VHVEDFDPSTAQIDQARLLQLRQRSIDVRPAEPDGIGKIGLKDRDIGWRPTAAWD
jgi:hypothetical protein